MASYDHEKAAPYADGGVVPGDEHHHKGKVLQEESASAVAAAGHYATDQ